MKCLACDNEQMSFLFSAKDYISGENFSIHRCVDCGSAIIDPIPGVNDLGKYYEKQYYGKRKFVVGDIINRLRLKKVFDLVGREKNLSILDVGCGNGGFLMLLSKNGFLASGTEVAPEDHFVNKEISSMVCKKNFPECGFPDAKFDIVTMWHTLEHFSKPLDYLLEVKRVLKNNGFLIIEVPNFQSWQSKLFKDKWLHLEVPRHIVHFSPEGLTALLDKNGFKVLKISTNEFIHGFFGFIQSGLNLFCQRKNFLFDILNQKAVWQDLKNNFTDSTLTLLLVAPISFVAIIFLVAEHIFNRGSILTVSAQFVKVIKQ